MTILITLLIVVAFANLWKCLHYAYTTARDLNDGGYPIYGDAIQNLMFLAGAAMLADSSPNSWYRPYTQQLSYLATGVFILNVWLIGFLRRAGDRAGTAKRAHDDEANTGQHDISRSTP